MRKLFITFITFSLLITLGCSAQTNGESNFIPESSRIERNTSESESTTDYSLLYDYEESYNMSTEESIFQKAMKANPIDKKYYDELNLATTAAEFCNLEKRYIDIWKNELDFSINNFINVLKTTDKENFIEVQNAWESSILDQINFERDFISNQEDYNISLGTNFQHLYLSEIRESYRERTFRIKYLLYLHEQNNTQLSELDYQSLIFISK